MATVELNKIFNENLILLEEKNKKLEEEINLLKEQLNKKEKEFENLEIELNKTKEHLKKYTAPSRNKKYYEAHKEELLEKMKLNTV
jgi:molecular chaperone GrpE (heat shock protein)